MLKTGSPAGVEIYHSPLVKRTIGGAKGTGDQSFSNRLDVGVDPQEFAIDPRHGFDTAEPVAEKRKSVDAVLRQGREKETDPFL